MKNIFKILFCSLVLFSITALAFGDVEIISPNNLNKTKNIINKTIIVARVKDLFKLDSDTSSFGKVKVKPIFLNENAATPEYLVVYLLKKEYYYFETKRVNLNSDYSTSSVQDNYNETPNDRTAYETAYQPSEGDDNVTAIVATPCPEIPSALSGVNMAAVTMQTNGFIVKTLIGTEATVDAYKYWLNKPNIRIFGQIGHGNTSSIVLADGVLAYYDFNSINLDRKVVYFNSCQVHNDPLEGSIIGAGVQKYIGGNINLLIGPSEEVFKYFWILTITNRQGMTSSLTQAENDTYYPDKVAHGISGNGSDYIFIDKEIYVDQIYADGNRVQQGPSISQVGHWETNTFVNYTVPQVFTFNIGNNETMHADINLWINSQTGSQEKYRTWNNSNDVVNHGTFAIQPGLTGLTSQFSPTNPATIQAQLIEGGGPSGGVYFRDPWLIDSADALHGGAMMNRGMNNALFKSVSYSQNNLDTNTAYKGVFLLQGYPNWTPPYYTVSALQTQPISVSGKSYTGIFMNWSGHPDSVAYQNANALQTGVVFKQSGAIAKALYKGTHLSAEDSAFSRNSQRKFIQTTFAEVSWLHQVYTSLDHVWIEHSSDGGNTWILGNEGKPLDTGGGKCPSIAFELSSLGDNHIGVVWQQPFGTHYSIQGSIFNQCPGYDIPYCQPYYSPVIFHADPSDSYGIDANPNILMNGHTFLVMFERKTTGGGLQPGLHWIIGETEDAGMHDRMFGLPQATGYVNQTYVGGVKATSAQMAADPYGNGQWGVYLIYKFGTSVRWVWLNFFKNYYGWEYMQDPTYQLWTHINNYNPNIAALPNGNFSACWINNIEGNENGSWPDVDQMMYHYSGNPSVFYYYGYGVQSCAINLPDNSVENGYNNGFAAWSQIYNSAWSNKSIPFVNGTPQSNNIRTLNTTGKYVQMANGLGMMSMYNMYVSSFSPFTLPYYFSTSQDLGSLLKEKPKTFITGTGYIISKDNLAFSYRFDDLNVDGNDIAFVEAPDTMDYSKINNLNNVLITEPFRLNGSSNVIFTERSGFTDTAAAMQVLGKNGYIKYKVELIDNSNEKVVGTIRNITLNSANPHSFKMPSYSLNTAGLGNKTVRLRLTVLTNLSDAKIALTKSLAEVNIASNLAKSSLSELSIDGVKIPETYALSQNYPNPFNPSTKLDYQLPYAGHVTLKVYDVLGREVATLADGLKEAGYYTVTFDGSRLSSGIYFMRLTAKPEEGKPFVQVKKMLMMK